MDKNNDVVTFIFQNTFLLRKLRVANLAHNIKLQPCLIKPALKTQELGIMYQNTICIRTD